jgi:hypothetical protein
MPEKRDTMFITRQLAILLNASFDYINCTYNELQCSHKYPFGLALEV